MNFLTISASENFSVLKYILRSFFASHCIKDNPELGNHRVIIHSYDLKTYLSPFSLSTKNISVAYIYKQQLVCHMGMTYGLFGMNKCHEVWIGVAKPSCITT